MNTRQVALDILRQHGRGHEARRGGLREAVDQAIRRHHPSPADAGLLTELVYGAVRHAGSLDAIIAAFSRAPIQRLDDVVHAALRVGLYQIVYLDRVPQSAAVNETVAALKRQTNKRATGFANAVLRSACRSIQEAKEGEIADELKRRAVYVREGAFAIFDVDLLPDPSADAAGWLAGAYSMPKWLVRRWIGRMGFDAAERVCAASDATPTLFLRANARRTTREELSQRLSAEGIHALPGTRPESLDLGPGVAIGRIRPFLDAGLCSVQDDTAMQVAPRLDPQPGERILELCAAPGGKTTHMAELAQDGAPIFAVDFDSAGVARIGENCRRMGIVRVACVQGDATRLPLAGEFDKVLLDVPCSNTGVLARRADARWRLRESDLARLCELQARLLRTAAERLRAGGALVYSTCSIEPEENADLIRQFVSEHSAFELAEEHEFLPHEVRGDGGYVARLVRSG